MAQTLSFEIFANDKASATAGKVGNALRRAAVDLQQAQHKVERSSLAAAAAEQKFGKESLQAREAITKLARAELDAERATERLAASQKAVKGHLDGGTDAQRRSVSATTAAIGKYNSLKAGLVGVGATIAGVTGAFYSLNKIMQTGTTINLQRTVAQATLGADAFQELSTAAQANARDMGLTTNEFIASAGSMARIAVNLGFAKDEAAQLGGQLPRLASNLAVMSGGTVDAATASDALRSAIAGEFDPLQNYGIAINAAGVQTEALAIKTASGNKYTDQQAQALAVVGIVAKQTAGAYDILGTAAGKSLTKQNQATSDLKQSWEDLQKTVSPAIANVVGGFNTWVNAATKGTSATDNWTDRGHAWVNALAPSTIILDEMFGNTLDLSKAQKDAAGSTDKLSSSQQNAASNAKAQQTAIDSLTKSLDANNNKLLQLRGGETGYWASVDAATDALRENGQTLDVHTEKGRANRDALDSQASAALDYLDSIKKQGQPASVFNSTLDKTYGQLYRQALQFSGNRKWAKQYADQILGIPHAANTKISLLGAQAAAAALGTVISRIGWINGHPARVRVYSSAANVREGRTAAMDSRGRAGGGWIPGTPSMRDTVPAMLAQGEFVVNSLSAARYAPVLERINRSGYAGGGVAGGGSPGPMALGSPVINLNIYSPIGDVAALESWLQRAITNLQRKHRI
jgi:hypothetical protein